MSDNLNDKAKNLAVLFSDAGYRSPQLEVAIQDMAKSIGELQARMAEAFAPIGEFARAISAQLPPLLAGLSDTIGKLPPAVQEQLVTLGKRGWYISLHMDLSILTEALALYQEDRPDAADELIGDYYTDELDTIQDYLSSKFPKRSPILSSAFSAHKKQDYVLSVPVFLAQADGICQELTGVKLFAKSAGKPVISKYIDDIANDSLIAALLQPLSITMPISANTVDLESVEHTLNRHAVLHGISIEYGTKVNSLKSISMLNYIVNALDEARNLSDP